MGFGFLVCFLVFRGFYFEVCVEFCKENWQLLLVIHATNKCEIENVTLAQSHIFKAQTMCIGLYQF